MDTQGPKRGRPRKSPKTDTPVLGRSGGHPNRGRDLGNLPPEQRCVRITTRGKQQCKKPRMVGLDVCLTHAPSKRAAQIKSGLAKIDRMGYGSREVSPEHVGANPVSGLAWEIRRTAGNIEAINEKLAQLRDEDFGFGQVGKTVKTSREAELRELIGDVDDDLARSRGGESYTIETHAARLNLWVELGLRERRHYAALLELAFKVNFEERKVRLVEAQVADLNAIITGVLRQLGHDPNDAAVRATVRQEILAVLPVPV